MRDRLELFTCTSSYPPCGFVSTVNFRDTHCPVCKTVGKVDKITILTQYTRIEMAPQTEEDKA